MRRFSILLVLMFVFPQLVSAAGSQTFTASGTFTVPAYGSLTVYVNGAGGGGSGGSVVTRVKSLGGNGSAGGASSFNGSVVGYGGGGASNSYTSAPSAGASGGATGGDANTTGGGAAGGAGGSSPWMAGAAGGAGGRAQKTYTSGALTPGAGVSVAVGAGGAGGSGSPLSGAAAPGSPGSPGSVTITWTDPLLPTCSTSLSPTTVAYGSGSTLSYSSSNVLASQYFTINTVGAVTSNVSRSTTVYSAGSYNGYIKDVSTGATIATCSPNAGTLTVTAPASPASTITSSIGATMNVGQTSTITATFTAGSGDTLTHDNIDSPVGTGLGADTNPGTKTYTFTPSTAGTYTFYARAQTAYYPSWATYNSITITVSAPCTLNGTTLQSGQSATFYSSQTAPSGQLCSSVAQSRTCTNGVLSGSAAYQYSSCTCAPLYSCSGNDVTYTDGSCSTSTVASCVAPQYCSEGTPACVTPSPTFPSNGHLKAAPSLVRVGGTAVVSWNVSNVTSCTVTGSNGQTWSTTSGSQSTLPITQQTSFTLSCTPYAGQTFTPETQLVNLVPVFQEQ